jgi:hypothetical protein
MVTANKKALRAAASLIEKIKTDVVIDPQLKNVTIDLNRQINVGNSKKNVSDIANDLANGLYGGKKFVDLDPAERSKIWQQARKILIQNKNGFKSADGYLEYLASSNEDFKTSLVGKSNGNGSRNSKTCIIS